MMTQEENDDDIEEIDASLERCDINGLMSRSPGLLLDKLPQCMKKRLNALKNIQVQCAYLEGKFYEEAHALEMKYAGMFKPMYDKRKSIVTAKYEPSEKEIAWTEPGEEMEDEKPEEAKSEEEEARGNHPCMDQDTKGIPEFWLTAMKNVDILDDLIKESDEEILRHLTDVNLILTGGGGESVFKGGATAAVAVEEGKLDDEDNDDEDNDEDMGFVLEFHFSPNDYFTNRVLTKRYRMKSIPDKDDPFSFDGPEIYACTGCAIDWKKGKNITEKQIKKKQKHKGGGQVRFVTKTIKVDSFFNFFDPPEIPDNDDEELDEETEDLLAVDFEIGDLFRQRIIPRAVLFYTGEALDIMGEESSDEEDDDSSAGYNEDAHEYEDDDDDDDEDENDADDDEDE